MLSTEHAEYLGWNNKGHSLKQQAKERMLECGLEQCRHVDQGHKKAVLMKFIR